MTVFWMYAAVRRARLRPADRRIVMKRIASAQKRTVLRSCGVVSPESQAPAYRIQTITVTRWKTPTTSSVVEWSVRSSSLS